MTADLVRFAQSEKELIQPQEDGSTLRDHLNSLWRQSGIQPQALKDAPDLPEHGAHVWAYFCQLNLERGSTGMGPARITSQNMKDWCWATGLTLDLWERAAIRAIDSVWMTDG